MGPPAHCLVPAVGDGEERLREPQDGDGVSRALAAAIAEGRVLNAAAGSFRSEPAQSLRTLLPDGPSSLAGLDERRLGVEQSNTSVALGESRILKGYRRLEAGENPELEGGS